MGKEPRHNCCASFFRGGTCLSTLETFPTSISFPGMPLGKPNEFILNAYEKHKWTLTECNPENK